MINIRQRRQQLSTMLTEKGPQTIRKLAAATGISKSSVHRHQKAIKQRQQYPESPLWETAAGEQWLKLLVIAAIYVFGIKRGVGAESLCEFFHKLHLEHYIGVSISSVRKIQGILEEKILSYQEDQSETFSQARTALPAICVGLDETWFEQTVLVMLELSSGYLFVETMVTNHQYSRWQEAIEQVLQRWKGHLQYCVNDRAKALIKLALNDLGCPSIADLFHAMRKLSQGLGFDLERRLTHWHRRLREWQASATQTAAVGQALQSEYDALKVAQSKFREHLMNISLGLHPFDISTLCTETTGQVAAKLNQTVEDLKQFQKTQNLKDTPDGIGKFSRQIDALSAVVDVWWQWVHQALAAQTLSQTLTTWITTILLPVCYWQYQTQRTDKPALKVQYREAFQQAQQVMQAHPTTATIDTKTFDYWHSWASEMVTKFQRTTAAVEGRNGYLSQIHHSCRSLSVRRLRVMTVIHNFDLKRSDGSTAAERLFKKPHPDVFQSVFAQMPDLPLPRQRTQPSKAQNHTTLAVPA